MNLLKLIYGNKIANYEKQLEDCQQNLEQIKKELNSLSEQRRLASQDMEAILKLLNTLVEDDSYDNVPVVGRIFRQIDFYLNERKKEQQIEWVRQNGTVKQPVSFHGGCVACKSPETVGIYRCLGCKYLMGITSNYPDLSFR